MQSHQKRLVELSVSGEMLVLLDCKGVSLLSSVEDMEEDLKT
jgi:hypothetical protein